MRNFSVSQFFFRLLKNKSELPAWGVAKIATNGLHLAAGGEIELLQPEA